MKIDWNEVATKVVTYSIVGLLALSLHLIGTKSIDGYDKHEAEINALQLHHTQVILEEKLEDDRAFSTKLWRTITFYEFRK